MVRVWLSSISFNDGTQVELKRDDVVVFVGPNNAGKSETLRELRTSIQNPAIPRKIITNSKLEIDGSVADLNVFLRGISIVDEIGSAPQTGYRGWNFSVNSGSFDDWWGHAERGLEGLAAAFALDLGTEQRLQISRPVGSIAFTTTPAAHPVHYILRDDTLESKFSQYFRKAFGFDLILHRSGGNEVPVYVGQRPSFAASEDRVSLSYLKKVEALDLLWKQGDGMRAFFGVLVSAFVSYHTVLLIDEPEAFLHPPQARLLGKILLKDLPPGRQMFLATHSEDFVKGILDANSSKVKIVRLQRNGGINKVNILQPNDIAELWKDPFLRHSNTLSGIFHSKVIICESEGDSRFYHAIISSIYEGRDEISPDVLFVNCGGKHRVPTVIRSLKKLGVEILVITDFDILNAENPLRDIFEGLGYAWSDIEPDWRILKSAVEQLKSELDTADVKRDIKTVLDGVVDMRFPKDAVDSIKETLKRTSPWALMKKAGKSFIPAGDATNAFSRLESGLATAGIHVVPCGEIECFDRSVGRHGPSWVVKVLEDDLSNAKFDPAREFISKVLA